MFKKIFVWMRFLLTRSFFHILLPFLYKKHSIFFYGRGWNILSFNAFDQIKFRIQVFNTYNLDIFLLSMGFWSPFSFITKSNKCFEKRHFFFYKWNQIIGSGNILIMFGSITITFVGALIININFLWQI